MKAFYRVVCYVLGAAAFLRGAEPAEELKLAVEKLAEARTYAWKQTFSGPDYPTPVVITGTAERDGFAVVTLATGAQVTRSVRKGEYFSLNELADGRWQTAEEAQAALAK